MISHVHSSATRERGNPDFCRSRDFPFLKFLLDRITNYKHFLSLADWFVGSFLILPEVRVALSVRFLEFEVWKRHAQGILFLPSSLASLFGVGRPLMKLSWTSFPRGWNLLRVSVLSLGIVCWLRLIFIRFAAWEFSTKDQWSSAFCWRLSHSFFSWTMIFNARLNELFSCSKDEARFWKDRHFFFCSSVDLFFFFA